MAHFENDEGFTKERVANRTIGRIKHWENNEKAKSLAFFKNGSIIDSSWKTSQKLKIKNVTKRIQ